MGTDFFAETVAAWGFEVERQPFDCMDWTSEGAALTAGGTRFEVSASPYTLGCRVDAPLAAISTVEELEAAQVAGAILLLRGEIAAGQLMPKNFPYYNPDEHKRIVRALEVGKPAAIVAATTRDPQMVGAVYPFPLIEDGDFDIPSVYMTEDEGSRLAAHAGSRASLEIRAERRPATGCNVSACKGVERRVVILAHVDAKRDTPGALDDASGIVVLLLLAELLADYAGNLGIEILAMNGEDYYSAPGEQEYFRRNAGRMAEIVLAANLDGAGYRRGGTAYSLYGCSEELAGAIRRVFSAHQCLVEGEAWYQGDHSAFMMYGTPALAITSELGGELSAEIAHTPRYRPEIVDPGKLVRIALALRDLVLSFSAPG